MEAIIQRTCRLLFLLIAAWQLAGCATNPVTGNPNFVLMSEEQEVSMGQKVHQDVLKQYAVYDDPEIQAMVDRIGQELAANSHRGHLDFTFTVLDSPEVNAFATPGGYIYITRGIMAYMNSEEELAGVLGHEIGHVTARHSVRQHSAQTANRTVSGLLGVAVAVVTGNNNAGQIVDVGLGQAGQALVSGYGRSHELEADRLGAEYLAGVGYDPQKMLQVVGILKDQEAFELQRAREEGRQPRVYHGVFATHPRNDARLQEVVRAADRFRIADPRKPDPKAFLETMDGLTFGSSEDQGILRSNAFYHKPLDLFMAFPEGWKVQNRPTSLLSVSPDQEQAILVVLDSRGEAPTPEQFLRKHFTGLRQGRSIDNDSYTAIAVDQSNGNKASVRVSATFHGDKVLVLQGVGKRALPDDAVLETERSIRELKPDEVKIASGQRIRLTRARPGDTFTALAARSALDRYAEDQLRLLNGMYPDGEPVPGQLIKIID